MREAIVAIALVVALALDGGCGARMQPHPMSAEANTFDAGLLDLASPIRLYVTEDETTVVEGVPTHIRRWEASTDVFALFVASIERPVPFTGPRDEILAASMGEEAEGGSIGPVTFDYTGGVFTASANAAVGERGEASVQMRAFMTRTRLVVIAVGGRPAPVAATMSSISLHPRDEELFFRPRAEPTSSDMSSVWGMGFSCRMPGGVSVEQSERGTMRYVATGHGYTAIAYTLADEGEPLEQQAARIARVGTVIEDTEDFLGGVRFRRMLVQADARWHAVYMTQSRVFQLSGDGTPSERDRDTATAFFTSCVF